MRYFIIFLIFILLFINCQKKEKKSKKEDKDIISSFKTKTIEKKEEPEKKKPGIIKRIFKDRSYDEDFFKGGFKTIKGKKYGVYYTESGDNVWIIAEKFCKYYLKKEDYNKTDIGNVYYSINLVNYNKLFGGINDDLKVRDKVLIPLHYEEYIEEHIKRIR